MRPLWIYDTLSRPDVFLRALIESDEYEKPSSTASPRSSRSLDTNTFFEVLILVRRRQRPKCAPSQQLTSPNRAPPILHLLSVSPHHTYANIICFVPRTWTWLLATSTTLRWNSSSIPKLRAPATLLIVGLRLHCSGKPRALHPPQTEISSKSSSANRLFWVGNLRLFLRWLVLEGRC